jgi:transcription initiation factor TFIIE subunit alpha
VIPSSYIYKHSQGSKKNSSQDEYELAIAQDTGLGQGDIIVDLQMDNEAARRAKMEEAEQKRQQNALPVWHQRSTISDTVLVATDRSADAEEGEEEEVFEDAGALGLDPETEDCELILEIYIYGIIHFFFFIDYAKYYESLSNNVGEEGFEEEDENRKRSHEDMEETFEEQASEEEFDEEGDIPMVSGKKWIVYDFIRSNQT